jgi:high mobility group AT-hook protein 2
MRGRLPRRRVPPPSPLLFKCWECSRLRAHSYFSLRLDPLLSDLSLTMPSLSGSTAGGDEILEGGEKKTEALEMTPPASRKRGCPKGSRNKKTLAALAAAAAAATTRSTAARALGDAGVLEKQGPGRPRGSEKKTAPTAAAAPMPPRRRGRPPGSKNKRNLATLGAATSNSTRLRATTSSPDGPSRLRSEKPALQPPAYISAEGWSTCIIPVLAEARDLLRLPS